MERSNKLFSIFCRYSRMLTKRRVPQVLHRRSAVFVLSAALTVPFTVKGQTEDLNEFIVTMAEELAGDESGTGSLEEFTDRLHELSGEPVAINSNDRGELERLFFLSDFQLKVIADYSSEYGPMKTVYEIANIPGFDRATAEMMAPFITFGEKTSAGGRYLSWRNSLLTSASLRSTDMEPGRLGSPWKLLSKYRFSASSLSGGITAEKDAGESLPRAGTLAPDFTSAYISYSGTGMVRKIVAGDYGIRFGMGSALNTGISTGLSLTSPGYMSGRNEIRPHTSADEYNYFRGVAAEVGKGRLGLTTWFSDNLVDAGLDGAEAGQASGIKNIYTSGLHNTPSLVIKKDRLREINYGASVSYDLKNLRLGILWSETRFPDGEGITGSEEDPYSFSGNLNRNFSFTYKTVTGNIIAFGEFTLNNGDSHALVQGVSLRPSGRLTVNLLYRNYSPGYTTFHGRAPGTGSQTKNEQGLTGNFTLEAARNLFVSAGYNVSHYPWMRYRTSFPSYSGAGEIRLRYEPSSSFQMELSANLKETVTNNNSLNIIPGQSVLTTITCKLLVKYIFSEKLSLVTRIYYRTALPGNRVGTVLSHDLICSIPSLPVRLWLRFSPFRTEDWDTRLYVYENDLLQSYSIPALSGSGCRNYAMVRWDATENIKLIMKYGATVPFNDDGDRVFRDDFRIQLSLKF